MSHTLELARFTTETDFEDLPVDLIEHGKVLFLDNIAAGFIGAAQPWSQIVAEMVREQGGKAQCSIFGQPWKTTASGAALVNGVMIGAFESEHAAPIGGHPSGNVFPAVFAIAEQERKDGKTLLAAMLLGYEVICRIADASTRAVEDERGFHTPGTNGAFGAAIGVGKLIGLDARTLANAMGIAGSHSSGLAEFVWEGAMTKRLHLGRGGQMGLESAVLAGKGFTGPTTVLEGKKGYLRAFSPKSYPERLTANLGKVWLTKEEVFIKPYSCHGTQQAVVQAICTFKDKHPIKARDIRKVIVKGSYPMMHLHEDQEPKSVMGAQYSMPFVVAIALVSDIRDPYRLNESTLWNEEVRALAKRVETGVEQRFVAVYDPKGQHAEVTIETTGGERHVLPANGFKGLPVTPLNFDDISDKLCRYAGPQVKKERVEEIVTRVKAIDQLKDVSELARLITP
jgi:2-methylcitrate dehydratase PrpD